MKKVEIIPNDTKIRIKGTDIVGTISSNDEENSLEDLSNLNYYVIPKGKTIKDYVMVHHESIEII